MNASLLTEMPRGYLGLYGGYYNWYAVTAESGNFEMVNVNAADSICPSGWHLPGTAGLMSSDSWYKLIIDSEKIVASEGTGDYSAEFRQLQSAPLSLTSRSGYADRRNGAIQMAGSWLLYWTSSAGNGYGTSRYLRFSTTDSQMGDSYPSTDGFVTRCLINSTNG